MTSLYPFVNKTGKIPIGHPEIITENFEDLDKYEGLVNCKVILPKGLFQPGLPCKMNGKLFFHLSKCCAETQQQSPCAHTDAERSFIGTWVTDKVKKAVTIGYKVIKLYEVWHFGEISKYEPETMTGGLFTEYVNTFLKIKQEASGWPDWCQTEYDKLWYIDLYEKKEGVRLEYHKNQEKPRIACFGQTDAQLFLGQVWTTV